MADNNQMKNVGDSLKQQFKTMFRRQAKIEGIVQSDPDVQAFLAKHQLTFEDEIVKKSFSKLYEFARRAVTCFGPKEIRPICAKFDYEREHRCGLSSLSLYPTTRGRRIEQAGDYGLNAEKSAVSFF